MSGDAADQRRRLRRRRYEVVFYTPWIGSLLTSAESVPPGGAETQILMLATELAAQGMPVAIVVFGAREEVLRQVAGVSIVVRAPYHTPTRPLEKLAEVLTIWRSLWRAPSRTIVFRGAGPELGVIAMFARLTRRRLVYSSANVADFDVGVFLPARGNALLHNLGARLADTIVVQTEEQLALCKAKFGRRATLIRSLGGLVESQRGPGEAFLWVGRITSYKRPLAYIELARALPEARFWMVGVPTPHVKGDEQLIERVRREAATVDNLELLPPQPHAKIGQLMSHAVASVSTADFEGMPNVLLEAWSRGIPALVLTHDPDGVVSAHGLGSFAGGSFERLVALARDQWAHRDDRAELARRCREYSERHHQPRLIARQWVEVLLPASRSRR